MIIDEQNQPASCLAEDALPSIYKLDEATINKIAAGEVVVSPSAALKELIENSIDAGASTINILSQKGGFSLLQIQDDGHGIKRGDFPILCERFTTSKIKEFNDLRSVASFGFRGEALASISYVSRLTITSKTPYSDVAYSANFSEGQMVNEDGESPRPCAGHKGTIIQVRDVFYNNPQRQKTSGFNEEYSKIVDVVVKFSVHYPLIKFTCKKVARIDDKKADVSTQIVSRPTLDENETPEETNSKLNSVRMDIIRRQYGQNKAGKEMIQVLKYWEILEMGVNLILSKPNSVSGQKNIFLLFANSKHDRLVECEKIKRTIDQVYSLFQPKGGYSYFVYMGLSILPELIDVNVHPTKKTVIFERQDELCEALVELIEETLQQACSNRTYQAQSMQSRSSCQSQTLSQMPYVHSRETSDHQQKNQSAIRQVRTDSQAMTLDKFLNHGSLRKTEQCTQPNSATVIPVKLISIKKLIYEFENDSDQDLQLMFKKHTYVGMLTTEQVLLQFGTKLVLAQTYPLLQEYLYQQTLRRFQQMQKYTLFSPLSLHELLSLALDHPDADYNPSVHQPKEELVNFYKHKLLDKAKLLEKYFGISIAELDESNINDKDNIVLKALPIIASFIKPYPEELPLFVLRLATDVDYSSEMTCFQQISEELSHYFAKLVELFPLHNQMNGEQEQHKNNEDIKFMYEHELFPEMKRSLVIRSKFAAEGDMTFSMITCTENLYKVFERC